MSAASPAAGASPRAMEIGGMFAELRERAERHAAAAAEAERLERVVAHGERRLAAAGEHLLAVLEAEGMEAPAGWRDALLRARMAGASAGEACAILLEEHGPATAAGLKTMLERAGFRFRGAAPLREIHAALIRNSRVRRDGGLWVRRAAE